MAYLRTKGKWDDADPGEADRLVENEPLRACCYAGSFAGTLIMGDNAGKRGMRLLGRAARHDADGRGEQRDAKPRNGYGFDVDARMRISAGDKNGRQRLARYIACPPLANDRIELLPDGPYRIALTHPWRDGTEAIVLPGSEVIGHTYRGPIPIRCGGSSRSYTGQDRPRLCGADSIGHGRYPDRPALGVRTMPATSSRPAPVAGARPIGSEQLDSLSKELRTRCIDGHLTPPSCTRSLPLGPGPRRQMERGAWVGWLMPMDM